MSGDPGVVTVTPNLFIVGAPKAGTTALSTYLDRHPDIWVAPYEMIYFGSDLTVLDKAGKPRRLYEGFYRDTFAPHTEEHYRGDHSVTYLCSERAAQEIHDFEPGARIVAMVREPVEQMYSQHSELLFQGEEDIEDFAEALAAEPARRRGERIPRACRKPFLLEYRRVASYAEQLERYLTVFGPDRVHVVVFDDFAADTASAYRGVLEFLGVDPGFAPGFEIVNPNKAVRSIRTRERLRAAPATMRRLGRLVVRDERRRAGLRRRIAELNTVQRPRPPLDPQLRRQLQEEMAPGVQRLEGLLERELGGWRAAPPA
ncbi:MAG TPA: sulfotransferase [Acidimicrobiales bacterium]|nr:sulfotransferase [Acidimicrobiales bacterium]